MEERIGIIGAGRLGSSLARAFCEAGCQVIAISDRMDSVAKVCAAQCDENTRAYSIDDLPTDLSVLILSVPDDEIGNVVKRLSYTLKISENTIIAHTSGALVSDILFPLRETTRNLASMHPIQTFSGSRDDWKLLFGLSYGLEGDRESLRRLEILLKKLKGKVFIIPKNKKALYHLSCVFASNLMLGVEAASIKIMEHIGFSESESFQLLEPLITATIENIKKTGPVKALTGPVARGDLGTVSQHLDELGNLFPDLLPVYVVLSQYLVNLSIMQKKADPQNLKEISDLLRKSDNKITEKQVRE